jgi:hypothetical protein
VAIVVYAYTTDVDIDADRYRKIVEGLGPEPFEGHVVHLCVQRPGGGLHYIDVWESEEHCAAAFRDRIHPAVDAAFGGTRPPEPQTAQIDVIDVRFGPS